MSYLVPETITCWSTNDPAIRERLVTLGLDPQPGPPDAFAERMVSDLGRWKQIIDAIGYKPG